MSLSWEPGAPLAAAAGGGPAFARRLLGGEAARDAARALAGGAAGPVAPLFGLPEGEAWRRAEAAAGPAGTTERLAALAAGRMDVVVTGQQPGFLGGPVLTHLKVATALALAGLRTAAGRPTAAVFWCGDDDEDLIEALSPVGWDAAAGLVRPDGWAEARAGRLPRGMVGPTPARAWCGPGAALLSRAAAAHPGDALVGDLAGLWERALAADWDWARLNVAAVRRAFAGEPLLVVRGNDPLLHAAAAGIYAALGPRRARCVELARERGRGLAAAGEPVPVTERSLARHLYAAEGVRRRALGAGEVLPPAPDLRPGVLLRSVVQDWLLRPVAVIVGPGEVAYLEQIAPVHAELGVPRAPLVPRLFAWLLRPGAAAAASPGPAMPSRPAALAAAALAARAAAGAVRDLARLLASELGLAPERAAALARGRARRWARGVAAMVAAEGRQQRRREGAALPDWLLPDGQRQERRLAALAAVATLGGGLPAALLAAARAHLEAGAAGDWREYLVR